MNTLQKKLKLIGGTIDVYGWNIIPKIVNVMGSITILESKWVDNFRRSNLNLYPLNLSDIKTWSTYDSCVVCHFKLLNSKFIECEAMIFDGDLFGIRRNGRFTATLKIPSSFLNELRDYIDNEFEYYCESKYNEHLENLKREWINSLKTELLSKKK